jgi:hypothetical protein
MTITLLDSHDRQTPTIDNHAPTEHPDTIAAQILVNLSSSSSTTSPGTPPLGDPTPLYHLTESNAHLSVSDICHNRAGLSKGVVDYLESPIDVRVEILLKTVTQLIATTPPLRSHKPRFGTRRPKQTPPSLASRITWIHPPPQEQRQQPRTLTYSDAVQSRPKSALKSLTPLTRQLVPLNRTRPTIKPRPGPPPIPHHSRPPPPGSPPTGFDSLSRQQLIDLLRTTLKLDPLNFGTPDFCTFRAPRHRAFRGKTLDSAHESLNSASNLLPRHRQPLPSQSHVFSQAHTRRQRAAQRPRRC